ncbi:hypothetical protein GLOIN_2v620650 [Rhizophagus clarus]|uniref:MIR domain-containing protein n=1 Tax=Rhizophagus clarus TaxID=94130 RepID=A0A8H3M1D1_9GLOM|nr:hypothetical protein GLOIN_2v620650 [Rhizophagus clarus]
MEIPKYNATVHPDEWIKDVQTKCLIHKIRQERDVLQICKLNITINLTTEPTTIGELTEGLKAHPTFDIFKNSCKEKLEKMKYEGGEGGNTAEFLAEFRSLCNNAEITNPREVRSRLLRTYPSHEFFRNEFSNRTSDITSIDEIFRLYSEVIADSSKVIKYGPEFLIAIKHLETGRYLSSCEVNYETGSQRQVIFAGEKILNDNCWWYLTCEVPDPHKKEYQKNKVLYEDKVYLTHNKTKATISLSKFSMAPATGHLEYSEVHCFEFAYSVFHFVKTDQTNEDNTTPYLKARDRVYIRTTNYVLRSHDVNFMIENKKDDNGSSDVKPYIFQEVVGHKEKVGKDDEVFII